MVPDVLRWETSLSHMTSTRVATEARATAQWISDHTGDPRRKYSTHKLREGVSDASFFGRHQSRWQDGITSCCRATPLSAAPQGQTPQGGGRQVLVVRGRKETNPPPPVHRVQGLAPPADHEAVEGYRVGVRVETPKGPLGQVALEGEGHGGGFGIPKGHQGGASAPEGRPRRRTVMGMGRARHKCRVSFFSFLGRDGRTGWFFPLSGGQWG